MAPISVPQPLNDSMFLLTTERLILRHFQSLDSEPLVRVFGDPEVMCFGDGVQTQEWIRAWLRTCLDRCYPSWGFGPYAVVERLSQDLVGYCGRFFFPDLAGQPEIELGYRLARAAWGQGYATEAAGAVRDYALITLGLKRLISMIDPANLASIRIAEKIDMKYEKEILLEGYSHPDHVYVINSPFPLQQHRQRAQDNPKIHGRARIKLGDHDRGQEHGRDDQRIAGLGADGCRAQALLHQAVIVGDVQPQG